MDVITATVTGVLNGLPALIPALTVTVLGALLAYSLGVRDPASIVVISTPLSVGALALTAEVLGWVGLGGLRLIAAALVLVALIGFAIARLRRHGRRARPAPAAYAIDRLPLAVWAAVAVAGGLALAAWLPGMGDLGLPPQGNDDIWHGYLVTRLGEMPVLTATQVAPVSTAEAEPVTVYPYGLHLAMSTAHALTGAGVSTTMNGAWAVYAGVLAPIGSALLCWRVFPGKPIAAGVAGLAAVTFDFFPYALNGVMPYAIALALVPGVLAAVAGRVNDRMSMPAAAVAVAALGVFVSHPAAALTAAVLGALLVGELLLRKSSPRASWTALIAPLALTILVCLPWIVRIQGTRGREEGVAGGPHSAVVDGSWAAIRLVLMQGSPWTTSQPLLALLVAAGALVVLRRRQGWSVLAGYVVFAGLFVAALSHVPVLTRLTGPWYGDWPRLLAVSCVVAPILVGAGVDGLHGLVRRLAVRTGAGGISRGIRAVGLVAALLIALQAAKYVERAQSTVGAAWQSPRRVSADDVALFHRLKDLTGERDLVLNNWRDGSTWMYAVAGVRPAVPYEATTALLPQWSLALMPRPNGPDQASCQLLLDNRVSYALGTGEALGDFPGTLEDSLRGSPTLFEPVMSNSAGTIFRVRRDDLARCAAGDSAGS